MRKAPVWLLLLAVVSAFSLAGCASMREHPKEHPTQQQ